MPNNFGGSQDHPAYDSRRKLNPKIECMVDDILYTKRKDCIEAEEINGNVVRYDFTDTLLPNAVRQHFFNKRKA